MTGLVPQATPFGSPSTLATILEGIGDGFYAVDSAWRVTIFNSECERHFGLTKVEVLGRELWEIFPEAYDTGLGRRFQAALASREVVISETPSVVKPGRFLEYRLFPLGDGMGVRFRDITDLRRAEEQRALLVRELLLAVDAIDTCVLLVAADCSIVRANKAAEDLLGRKRGVFDSHGKLSTADHNTAQRLRSAIAIASRPPHETRRDETKLDVLIERDGSRPLALHVVPLIESSSSEGAVTAVFISDPEKEVTRRCATFARLYNLTAAEERLFAQLLSGAALPAAAHNLGITESTGRTHLKHILAKTNTGRQAELVTLYFRSSIP